MCSFLIVARGDFWAPDHTRHLQELAEALGLGCADAIGRDQVFEKRESYGRAQTAEFTLSPKTGAEFETAPEEFGYVATAGP